MSTHTTFEPPPTYERFTRSDRVQHAVMAISFLVLTVTGLPQKFIYANSTATSTTSSTSWAGSRRCASSTAGRPRCSCW